MANPTTSLHDEVLITLEEAAEDFGGVKLPMSTLRRYVQSGYRGLKLETVNINRRYTSREAIRRFIERKQGSDQMPEKPKIESMTQAQVDAGLRKYRIIK